MKSQTTRVLLAICLCLSLTAAWRWLSVTAQERTEGKTTSTANATNFPVPITSVCGPVTEFQAATAASTGLLTIGGVRFILATGANVGGFAVGGNVCATFCLDANGQVTNVIGGITANAAQTTTVCGTVTEWKPWERLTIGGAKFRLEAGQWLTGQSILAPALNACLFPVYNGNNQLTLGSSVTFAPGTLPISVPALVHGTKYGPDYSDGDESTFRLPSPFILNVQTPIPAGAEVKPASAGYYWTPYTGFQGKDLVKFCSTTPGSVVRATACAESLWDIFFQLETSGATDGDMVTLALQNPDGSNVQVLAMFTIQNGNAVITQIHPDLRLVNSFNGGSNLHVGQTIPLHSNGQGGLRSDTLYLVFNMNSTRLDGCFQYYAEIKRASGAGTTCITHVAAMVKRKEQSGDRLNEATDLESNTPGWFPTGLPCQLACNACLPPPPDQPLPGSLSGYVYCDINSDGVNQGGNEVGLANVTITLTGIDVNGPVNKVTVTNAAGFYTFPNLMPGVYKITETQPAGTTDGLDTVGTLGGTTTNDMFSNIPLPSLGKGENYNFGEHCVTATPTPTPTPPGTPTPTPTPTPPPVTPKCDTVCWRGTQWLLNNQRSWPGGTVLAIGYNANNPMSVQSNQSTIRNILTGGFAQSQRLNREFVAAQMSLLMAGGAGSPVVFNVYWSPLRCSGVQFAPIALSNGLTFTSDSLLDTLMSQTVLAIRDNRSQDFDELANIWALVNGRCGGF